MKLYFNLVLHWLNPSFKKQKREKRLFVQPFHSNILKNHEILGWSQFPQVPLEILAKFHAQTKLGQGIQKKKIFLKYYFIGHRE